MALCNACCITRTASYAVSMPCDDPSPAVDGRSKRCRKCGLVKPVDAFSPDPYNADGRERRCRDCENERKRRLRAADRAQRFPWLLGLSDAADAATAVTGALRTHYDGRITRLIDDALATMREMGAADRFNAIAVLLALRELSGIAAEIGRRNQLLEELRRAPPD